MNALRVGQIARHCEVNPRTVHRWIREGKLASSVLPSGHFRIGQNDFRRFLVAHNFPLKGPHLDLEQQNVLVVDSDEQRVEALHKFFVTEAPYLLFRPVNSLLAASMEMGLKQPQILFLSFDFDPKQFQRFCRKLKERSVARGTLIYLTMDRGASYDIPGSLRAKARLMEVPFDARSFKSEIREYIYDS